MAGPTIVHLHIFKNAGTTLDWILRRNFANAMAEFHGPTPDSVLSFNDLDRFLDQHPEIRAISSHHLRIYEGHVSRHPIIPLLFLRDPLDRIPSIYEQERRQALQRSPLYNSLSDWVDWTLSERKHLICDSQTMFLATGGTYYDYPGIVEKKLAYETLGQLPLVGVVDQFDPSIVLLELIMKQAGFDTFDGRYYPQNISAGRGANLEFRLKALRDELGERRFHCLLENNQYDLALLAFARKALTDRLAAIPGASDRLVAFKSSLFTMLQA